MLPDACLARRSLFFSWGSFLVHEWPMNSTGSTNPMRPVPCPERKLKGSGQATSRTHFSYFFLPLLPYVVNVDKSPCNVTCAHPLLHWSFHWGDDPDTPQFLLERRFYLLGDMLTKDALSLSSWGYHSLHCTQGDSCFSHKICPPS